MHHNHCLGVQPQRARKVQIAQMYKATSAVEYQICLLCRTAQHSTTKQICQVTTCLPITGIHTELIQSAEEQYNVHWPVPDL